MSRYVVFGSRGVLVLTRSWVPYPLTNEVFADVGTSSRRMLTLMLRRTGRVAVAAVAAVDGVARLHLFLEGAGLICSFRLACFVFGP